MRFSWIGAKSVDLSAVLVITIGKRIFKWKHIGKKNNCKGKLKRRGRDYGAGVWEKKPRVTKILNVQCVGKIKKQ